MTLPRLGFLGVGEVGLDRLKALATIGAAEITAIADLPLDGVGAHLIDLARWLAPEVA